VFVERAREICDDSPSMNDMARERTEKAVGSKKCKGRGSFQEGSGKAGSERRRKTFFLFLFFFFFFFFFLCLN